MYKILDKDTIEMEIVADTTSGKPRQTHTLTPKILTR